MASPEQAAPASFTAPDPGFEARCRDSFSRQPAMHLIGASIAALRPGFCEVRLPHRLEVTQQHGFVHGGVLGMIADSAAGYAAYSLFPADSTVLTVEYKLNLMAPADVDELRARGQVTRSGRTLTVVAMDVIGIKAGREVHCATGIATLICIQGRPDTGR
ncbi:hotdog fold thioesterase [Ferrovibrio sp.]|uniref:PaaI family thioesterase n=1 Tax=Ferrovibrio sp. TaxID=1917215 RepID=UPI0025C63849|nr:hotdog fold thioesterase [Ferrovibrio sp.]MBX3454438.1 hotdog fold thioesterase [Ferrovibrio sp.]